MNDKKVSGTRSKLEEEDVAVILFIRTILRPSRLRTHKNRKTVKKNLSPRINDARKNFKNIEIQYSIFNIQYSKN